MRGEKRRSVRGEHGVLGELEGYRALIKGTSGEPDVE